MLSIIIMNEFTRPVVYPKTHWLRFSVPSEKNTRKPQEKKEKAELSLLDFSGYFDVQKGNERKTNFLRLGYLKRKISPMKKTLSSTVINTNSQQRQPQIKLQKMIFKCFTTHKKSDSRKISKIPSQNLPFKTYSSRTLSSLKNLKVSIPRIASTKLPSNAKFQIN